MGNNLNLLNSLFYSQNLFEAFKDTSNQIAQIILNEFEINTSFLFLIGKGLNGVDGFFVAVRLKELGFKNVEVVSPYKKDSLALKYFVEDLSSVKSKYRISSKKSADVVVDSLVGTGFKSSKVYAPLVAYKDYIDKSNSIIASIDGSISLSDPDYDFSIVYPKYNNSRVVKSVHASNINTFFGPAEVIDCVLKCKKSNLNKILFIASQPNILSKSFLRNLNSELTYLSIDQFVNLGSQKNTLNDIVQDSDTIVIEESDNYLAELLVQDIANAYPHLRFVFVTQTSTTKSILKTQPNDSLLISHSTLNSNPKSHRCTILLLETSTQVLDFAGEKKFKRINLQDRTIEIALIAGAFMKTCSCFESSNAAIFLVDLAQKLKVDNDSFEPNLIKGIDECFEFASTLM